jgi:tol-pal system protein YbgF
VLAWAAAASLGCVGTQSQRLSDVDGELAHVEHDHESSDVRWGLKLDEAESRKSDDALIAPAGPNTPSAPMAAAKGAPAKALARPVVRLDEPAPLSPLEGVDGAAVAPEDDDAANRPLLKLGPRGQIEQTDPDDGAPRPVAKKGKLSAPDAAALVDYEQAQKLVGAKKWQAALDAFAGFLLRYPDHPYASNAFYWRGECYYALGDFGSAVAQFEGLVARFPVAAKVPDALLKLGLSERKLGSTAKAKTAFDRLKRDYPLSEAAKKIPPEDAQ